jgi:hypothetical protein
MHFLPKVARECGAVNDLELFFWPGKLTLGRIFLNTTRMAPAGIRREAIHKREKPHVLAPPSSGYASGHGNNLGDFFSFTFGGTYRIRSEQYIRGTDTTGERKEEIIYLGLSRAPAPLSKPDESLSR